MIKILGLLVIGAILLALLYLIVTNLPLPANVGMIIFWIAAALFLIYIIYYVTQGIPPPSMS